MRVARSLSHVTLVLALSGTALTVAPSVALAQSSQPSEEDIAQARQLGQQAQAAYDAGNFAESEKLWAAARKLYPVAPTLTLGLARTEAKLGHVVAAQEHYNKIIREWSSHPSPPPAFAAALEAAKAEVGAVSSRVANVVVTVEGPKSPNVTIDGQPVPVVALGLRRPVDPGKHVVHAEAPGFKPGETTFEVAEGGSAETKVVLEAAPEPVAGPTPVAPAGDQQPANEPPVGADAGTGKSSNKTLAIVALGVGGAGLAVGAITGILAIGKHGDLDEACPNGTCPSDKQSDVDSYQTMGTISTIGFIVGAVGIGAGAVLWFTAPKKKTAWAPPKPKVTPYLGLGSAGVTGTF